MSIISEAGRDPARIQTRYSLEGEIKWIISKKTVQQRFELTGNISKDRWDEQLKTCGETIKSLFPSPTHGNCSCTYMDQQKYSWIIESPTARKPKTATLAPLSTLQVFQTAPSPVTTPHPKREATRGFALGLIFANEISLTTVYLEKIEHHIK